MAIRHGIVASSVALRPFIEELGASNFNESIASLLATVSANGYSTSVRFQYSTSSNFSTFTEVNAATTPITGQSVSCHANITGLSPNTTYHFRCVVTSDVGTVTSLSQSFTTWALQVYERSTSGGHTFTIPTVTPIGGSAVAVSIYDIIMFGGGGGTSGNGSGGGGGGGHQNVASRSVTGSRSITVSVGAGGSGTNVSGGNTTITGDITSLTANGGAGSDGFNGGASGNGNAGGGFAEYDPDGTGKGLPNTAFGGGGGAGGAGANGVANASGTFGGNGGNGVSITSGGVTRAGGAGGGGGTSTPQPVGTTANGATGANNTYGSGASGAFGSGGTGQAGYIRFRYYAASALA